MLFLFAFVFGTFALIAPYIMITLGLITAAATLLAIAIVSICVAHIRTRKQGTAMNIVSNFIARDATPSLVVTSDGQIISRNAAAKQRFETNLHDTLTATFDSHFANPGGIIYRLQIRANENGSAQEDIVTRAGHIRLCVHEVMADTYVWRVEQIADRHAPRAGGEGHQLPMLMVGRGDTILFMNDAALIMMGGRVKSLDRVFTALPVAPGVTSEISTTDGPKMVIAAEVAASAGRRALYLVPAPQDQDAGQGWQAFQDLPVPMIKVAPDGSVQSFNRMASKLIGVSLTQDIHLSHLMEGLGRSITDWLKDTLAGRMVQKSEFLRLTRTDREVFVQVTLNRITEEGAPALIAVLHDATELKSLEAQFVQSQKMQAIGQLAGGVAHDFNNLLTAISGHCDLLLLRHDQGDPDYADLMQVNQNANRAAALVGQLLAFSRKQTLQPETLDMRDTLADLTHL